MKVALILVALIGVGLYGAYQFGGYATFDPDKQAEEVLAQLYPGMPWYQVVDIAGEPQRYQVFTLKKETWGGQEIEAVEPGPMIKFNPETLASRLDEGTLPAGFNFTYKYSTRVAFGVHFDAKGIAETIDRTETVESRLFDQ